MDYLRHPAEHIHMLFNYEIKSSIIGGLIKRNTFDKDHEDYRQRKPQRKDMVGIQHYCDFVATKKNFTKKKGIAYATDKHNQRILEAILTGAVRAGDRKKRPR